MLDLVEDDHFPFAKQILNGLANDAVNDVNSNAHLSVESFREKNSFHEPENMIKYLNTERTKSYVGISCDAI